MPTIHRMLLLTGMFLTLGCLDPTKGQGGQTQTDEDCLPRTGCDEGDTFCFCRADNVCQPGNRCEAWLYTCVPEEMTDKEVKAENIPAFCAFDSHPPYFGPDSSQH